MHLIKLDATDSTNTYLHNLLVSDTPVDYTVVMARHQTEGRGQMGAQWLSEVDKNLTFSVLRKGLQLPAAHGFILNLCVSLTIYSVYEQLSVPDLSIKWPNDILSGTSKIGGILIENKISGNTINTSILGVGLNVNQLVFNNLQNASSLKLLLGKTFDLEILLQEIVDQLFIIFGGFQKKGAAHLWDAYENVLFGKGKHCNFKKASGQQFSGIITGVSKNGKLNIVLNDGDLAEFGYKEIKLIHG